MVDLEQVLMFFGVMAQTWVIFHDPLGGHHGWLKLKSRDLWTLIRAFWVPPIRQAQHVETALQETVWKIQGTGTFHNFRSLVPL